MTAADDRDAVEILLDGVTDDMTPFRDTIYALVEPDVDVIAALVSLCERHEIQLTELSFADVSVFDGTGIAPADTDREAFLSQVELLPDRHSAFAGCEIVLVDLHSEEVGTYGL